MLPLYRFVFDSVVTQTCDDGEKDMTFHFFGGSQPKKTPEHFALTPSFFVRLPSAERS